MADLRVPLYPRETDASKCIVAVTGELDSVPLLHPRMWSVTRISGVAAQAPPGSSLDLWLLGSWQLVRKTGMPPPDMDDSCGSAVVITISRVSSGHTVHGTVRDPNKESSVGHLKALPGAAERLKLFAADLLEVPLRLCNRASLPLISILCALRQHAINSRETSHPDECRRRLKHLKNGFWRPAAYTCAVLPSYMLRLTQDGSFDEAIKGATYVFHTASPYVRPPFQRH